jgi:dienelactone hydrolase
VIEQQRFPRGAWVPIAAGLTWLWCAASFGVVGFLFSLIPGCLLLASGVSMLLYPGDLRIPQFAALGGLLGVPLAFPVFWVTGAGLALVLIGLSAASFVAAGVAAVTQEPYLDDVPEPLSTLRLGAEVAVDEALLGTMAVSLPLTRPAELARLRADVHAARELFRDRGWLEKPADYHRTPPPLGGFELRPGGRVGAVAYEHLRFESGYEPWPEEPSRDGLFAREPNRTAHAWVVRQRDPSRPWLVCIHGYQMGIPRIDLRAFEAERLHHTRGLNLLFPVLPLHGPRKVGRRSGDGYLTGDALETIHDVAQAMWDVRRLLAWIRAQGATRVGVHGLSLGGYHTALLACLDDQLACAIPGIPLSDVTRAVWRHGPPLQLRYFERQGVVHEEVAEVLRVVSPLALEPRVPRERRYLYGAVADRLVPADQVRDLWRHWERPEIVWYQGGHVTFRSHPEVRRFVDRALAESGLFA